MMARMSGARGRARLPPVLAVALVTFVGTDLGEGRIYAPLDLSYLGWSVAFALIFAGLALLWLRPPHAWRLPVASVRWLGVLPVVTAILAMAIRGALHVDVRTG